MPKLKSPIDLFIRAADLALRENDLPAGVIGRIEGIALVYEVVDRVGTIFARGCLDRTIREKVAAGKVRLYWDHGDAMLDENGGFYDSDLHIGTVRSLTDVTLPDGKVGVYMVADLIDCHKAHEAKQYLVSLQACGGKTGLSVGFKPRQTQRTKDGPRFTEIELREISVTSMQAVEDAEVLAVRSDTVAHFRAALVVIIEKLGVDEVRAALDEHADEPVRQPQTEHTDPQNPQDATHQGNATEQDSDAGALTPDSDAEAEDSRADAPLEEPAYLDLEQRLALFRQTFAQV